MPTYSSTTVLQVTPTTGNVAFPAAGASANSTGVNINAAVLQRRLPLLALQVGWPALANHTDSSKIITITLQDSSDNTNWSNVNPLYQIQLPGVTTNGAAATNYRLQFPSHLSTFARIRIDNPAGGPAITDKNANVSLVSI